MRNNSRGGGISGGVALATECAAEPYIDSFDAFLPWLARTPQDVPLLRAAYSGYAVYFGSSQSARGSLDAYCALQGRDFLWGCLLSRAPRSVTSIQLQ